MQSIRGQLFPHAWLDGVFENSLAVSHCVPGPPFVFAQTSRVRVVKAATPQGDSILRTQQQQQQHDSDEDGENRRAHDQTTSHPRSDSSEGVRLPQPQANSRTASPPLAPLTAHPWKEVAGCSARTPPPRKRLVAHRDGPAIPAKLPPGSPSLPRDRAPGLSTQSEGPRPVATFLAFAVVSG